MNARCDSVTGNGCVLNHTSICMLLLNMSSKFRYAISWSIFIHIWLLYECCMSQQTLRLKINANTDHGSDLGTRKATCQYYLIRKPVSSNHSVSAMCSWHPPQMLWKEALSTADRHTQTNLMHSGSNYSFNSGSLMKNLLITDYDERRLFLSPADSPLFSR